MGGVWRGGACRGGGAAAVAVLTAACLLARCAADTDADVEEVLVSPYHVLTRPMTAPDVAAPAETSTAHHRHHHHRRRHRGHHRQHPDAGVDLWDLEPVQQDGAAGAGRVLTTRSVKQEDVTEHSVLSEAASGVPQQVFENLAEIEHAISQSSSRLAGGGRGPSAPRRHGAAAAATTRPESLIGPWDLSRTVQLLRRSHDKDTAVLAGYTSSTVPGLNIEAAKLEAQLGSEAVLMVADEGGTTPTPGLGLDDNEVHDPADGGDDDDPDDVFRERDVSDLQDKQETQFTPDDGLETTRDGVMEVADFEMPKKGHVDIVTRFLRIVESQHLLGENCTAGTDLNLGEGVVDRYAQL
ncbi:hypothetical protein ONE63_010722 [Megalurothrips usitatus]|uniref:Uncharacterized protein n=1 Tax=Megalurothrips usitatus TaxID=439358 RepID=A0AAV7XI78_9NEOP|nr:hypothetical protein ONE63_010722 [Megalurothrips usitatus]